MARTNRGGTQRAALGPEVLAEHHSGSRWIQELRIPEDLACWPGHFPEWRLVPGVLQIEWVMDVAARRLGRAPRVSRIEGLKFTSALLPGEVLTLILDSEDERRFHFELTDGKRVFSRGRFEIDATEDAPA